MRFCLVLLSVSAFLFHSIRDANAETRAFTNATILTANGDVLEPGTMIVTDGKISAIGTAKEIAVPKGAVVSDLDGKVIIPGLVDTHSHLGVYSRPGGRGNSDGNESTHPVQSIVRALDSLNPFDPGFKMALAGGVTTGNIMPGSANVIGGQTLYVKYRGYTPEQMWIGPEEVYGGLKMANGENPKRSYGGRKQAPGTRMKVAAMQRAEFIKAQQYMRKWDTYRKKKATGDDASAPDVDLTLEPLVEVLTGRRTVHFHTHRADDILTTLRLKKEFGFDLVIQHGTESYKVLDQVAAAGVPVSLTIVDSPGGKAEVVDFIEECGAELTNAGVKVIINTDDPVTESRLLLRTAAIAHRGGMSEEQTLRAITIHAAEAMKLGHRIGSLEKGKDADFVVLSNRPFRSVTRVEQTWIDGKQHFDISNDRDHHYQSGGFALADRAPLKRYEHVTQPQPVQAAPELPGRKEVNHEHSEFVVLAGRLYSIAKPPINDGMVHVKDGRIVYAGPRGKRKLPKNVPVITAASITPGMIDAHSTVPLSGEYNISADQDQDEKSSPNQADVRALDGFNPGEPLLQFLLQNGVTVIHACPGRANVISGLSGVFRTHGTSADEMVVRFPQTMVINLGNSPKETYSGSPSTRMGTAAVLRKALADAAIYGQKRKKAEEDKEPFSRDLKKEHLSQVINGELPTMFCAQRADDLLTALRVSKEFKLDPVLALAAEAYLVRETLAADGIPVIAHPTMQRNNDLEVYHSTFTNAAMLADENIPLAIGSGYEGYVPKTRVVRFEATVAMPFGLRHDRALHAVTLGPAKILGIDKDYGTLEKGKIADIVLYDGDPLEHVTHVQAVILGGKLVFRRSDAPRIPLADRMFYSAPEIPCCHF